MNEELASYLGPIRFNTRAECPQCGSDDCVAMVSGYGTEPDQPAIHWCANGCISINGMAEDLRLMVMPERQR